MPRPRQPRDKRVRIRNDYRAGELKISEIAKKYELSPSAISYYCADLQEERKVIKARCGTRAGYARHRRDRTTPCKDCKQAQADYMRVWTQQRKEAS